MDNIPIPTPVIQLRRLYYGFRREGVETVTRYLDVELITADKLQSIVWADADKKTVLAIVEIDLKNTGVTQRDAKRKLVAHATKLGVQYTNVGVELCYGGNVDR